MAIFFFLLLKNHKFYFPQFYNPDLLEISISKAQQNYILLSTDCVHFSEILGKHSHCCETRSTVGRKFFSSSLKVSEPYWQTFTLTLAVITTLHYVHGTPFPNTLPHWCSYSLWSIWNYLYFIWTEAVNYTHVKGTVSSPSFCVLPGFMLRLTWGKFRTIYLRSPCWLLSMRKVPHSVLITYFFFNSKEIVYFYYFTTHICRKVKGGKDCAVFPLSSLRTWV